MDARPGSSFALCLLALAAALAAATAAAPVLAAPAHRTCGFDPHADGHGGAAAAALTQDVATRRALDKAAVAASAAAAAAADSDSAADSGSAAAAAESAAARRLRRRQQASYNVPVWFHVLADSNVPAQNVAQPLLDSQITVLNTDFAATNPDASQIESQFDTIVAGNAGITFSLAGVSRVATAPGTVDLSAAQLIALSPQVDPTTTLNIYTAAHTQALGFAFPPGAGRDNDIVFIEYRAVGENGAIGGTYNLGRTTVHEVGHWLGLQHTWGGNAAVCTDDDGIADTPVSNQPYYGCNSAVSSCGSPDWTSNYMDYQDDRCLLGFSVDQVEVMRSFFDRATGYRRHMAVPNCGDGVIQAPEECDDAGLAQIDGCSMCTVSLGFECGAGGTSCQSTLCNDPNLFHEPFEGTTVPWTVNVVAGNPGGSPAVSMVTTTTAPVTLVNSTYTTTSAMRIRMDIDNGNVHVTSPSVTLPIATPGQDLFLAFWLNLDAEVGASFLQCYDSLRLIMIDGSDEIPLEAENIVTGMVGDGSTDFGRGWCNMPTSYYASQSSGTAAIAARTWRRVLINLRPYHGRTVSFRFESLQDGSVGGQGAFIDDFRIHTAGCGAAGPTPSTPPPSSNSGTPPGTPPSSGSPVTVVKNDATAFTSATAALTATAAAAVVALAH